LIHVHGKNPFLPGIDQTNCLICIKEGKDMRTVRRQFNFFNIRIFLIPIVCVLVSCAASVYNKACKIDTIEAYRTFITKYPDNPRRKLAEARIEELEFIHAKTLHAPDALKRFLSTYPNSSRKQEAKALLEETEFTQAKAVNTIEALEDFVSTYPNSPYVQEAINLSETLSFQKAKTENTVEVYEAFLKKYPNGQYASQASHELVKLYYLTAKNQGTIEAFQAFINCYPESPQAKEARYEIDRIRFEKAKNEHSVEILEEYIKQYPESPFIREALQYKDFLNFEKVRVERSITNLEQFIKNNPQNTYIPEAMSLLEELLGERDENAIQSYKRGEEYLNTERYAEAIKEFEKAIELIPDFVEAHVMLAVAFIKQSDKEYDEAYTSITLGLKVYSPERNLNEAEKHLKKALEINPQFEFTRKVLDAVENRRSQAELNRSQVELRRSQAELNRIAQKFSNLREYSSSHELDQIIQDLERLMDRVQTEPYAWLLLGMAKSVREAKWDYSWQPWEDGREEFEMAIALKEDFAEAHLWLGAVIAREGFEQIWGEDEKLMYYLNELHHLWRNGWSDDWYRTRDLINLPYSVREYLDNANKEWQRAIKLDDKMRDVFKAVIVKIFSGLD
jgi:outer membrane protein assembly factor BamD (BamD/ComL family)